MQIPFYSAPPDVISWDQCSGQNSKRTLILAVQSDIPEHLPLLKKILRAVQLDFDTDIAFLTMDPKAHVHLLPDPQLEVFQNVLTFGLRPANLGLPPVDESVPALMHFEKVTCLWAPALSEINGNPGVKKLLWSALKDVFETAAK